MNMTARMITSEVRTKLLLIIGATLSIAVGYYSLANHVSSIARLLRIPVQLYEDPELQVPAGALYGSMVSVRGKSSGAVLLPRIPGEPQLYASEADLRFLPERQNARWLLYAVGQSQDELRLHFHPTSGAHPGFWLQEQPGSLKFAISPATAYGAVVGRAPELSSDGLSVVTSSSSLVTLEVPGSWKGPVRMGWEGCCTLTVNLVRPSPRTVLLDPENDTQTCVGELCSNEVVMNIAERVKTRLSASSVQAFITRLSDQQLSDTDRTALAERLKPDLFLSLSIGNVDGRQQPGGISCYYQRLHSERAAQALCSPPLVATAVAKVYGTRLAPYSYQSVLMMLGNLAAEEDRAMIQTPEARELLAQQIAGNILKQLATQKEMK